MCSRSSLPFDTVKTKLQAQSGFGGSVSTREACLTIWRTEGPLGFYRGCLPPMWGSAVYRSAQFAVFETLHKKLAEVPALRERLLPAWSDMEACGASARAAPSWEATGLDSHTRGSNGS